MSSYASFKRSSNRRVEEEEEGRDRMWNNPGQSARRVAVAVTEGIASQDALKWAIQHLGSGSNGHNFTIKLVHVLPSNSNGNITSKSMPLARSASAANEKQPDLLLPFRCYCTYKRVECETVVLEDQDVAKAFINYIHQAGVENFVLAHSSAKNGFSRLLKVTDIPRRVLKRAPDFCTVYTISKGKLCQVRHAPRRLPNIPAADGRREQQSDHIGRAPSNTAAYDEVLVAENDDPTPFANSERQSTDSIVSFYRNFGTSGRPRVYSESSNWESIAESESDFGSFGVDSQHERSLSTPQHTGGAQFLSQKLLEDMEEEMEIVRTELKQMTDMYLKTYKEAVAATQKATELEDWKTKEGKRLEDERLALEATIVAMEKEKENSRAKFEQVMMDERAQRLAEKEQVRTTINADQIFKALKEAGDQEKKKVLDALGHSQMVSKCRSLVHISVVLLFFSFYIAYF